MGSLLNGADALEVIEVGRRRHARFALMPADSRSAANATATALSAAFDVSLEDLGCPVQPHRHRASGLYRLVRLIDAPR